MANEEVVGARPSIVVIEANDDDDDDEDDDDIDWTCRKASRGGEDLVSEDEYSPVGVAFRESSALTILCSFLSKKKADACSESFFLDVAIPAALTN